MANTQPGGAYEVGGKTVDANGNPTKDMRVPGTEKKDEGRLVVPGTPAATSGSDAELDGALFTPAALKKAQELNLTAGDFKRRRKSAAEGAKFSVEDVERIAASKGEVDEDVEQ